TWPSVLLRPSTHQIGAFSWLAAEEPPRCPKRLLTSKTALVIKLLKTSLRTEGVVLVLYRLRQLNAALPAIIASFDLHQCNPSKAILEMKRVSKSSVSQGRSCVVGLAAWRVADRVFRAPRFGAVTDHAALAGSNRCRARAAAPRGHSPWQRQRQSSAPFRARRPSAAQRHAAASSLDNPSAANLSSKGREL